MYTNTDCTIFEKTMGENKMPKWVKHVIKGVYWQSSEGQSQSSTHMNESDTALIIIHASKISYYPKHDDIIVKGLVEDNNITEVQKLPNSHTVMSVADFLYGSKAVQHIEVTAI